MDIQIVTAADVAAIAGRFFTACEQRLIARDSSLFFDIWTAKEAYLKYTGEGLAGGLGSFSVVDADRLAAAVNGVSLSFFDFRDNYKICVAHFGKNRPEMFVVD